jgi:hypothetical protein
MEGSHTWKPTALRRLQVVIKITNIRINVCRASIRNPSSISTSAAILVAPNSPSTVRESEIEKRMRGVAEFTLSGHGCLD